MAVEVPSVLELEILVHAFFVPNKMFAHTIMHLRFRASQIVVLHMCMLIMYLAVHLLQR